MDSKASLPILDMAIGDSPVVKTDLVMDELVVVFLGLHAKKCQPAEDRDSQLESRSSWIVHLHVCPGQDHGDAGCNEHGGVEGTDGDVEQAVGPYRCSHAQQDV